MTTQPSVDQAKLDAFLGKVLGDLSGTTSTAMCVLGDRLGLFKDLAANGPATSGELAARAGINERYAREWLHALAVGGYLEHDPASQRFTLPPEHAQVLAQEGGIFFLGGVYHMLPAQLGILDQLTEAFRQGGGVHQAAYADGLWDGMERYTGVWYENRLLQEWLPALPDVQARLERGAEVAEIGCGRGRALIKLAQAYPKSRYTGFDVFEPTIARAAANAEVAGVSDRVRFEHLDAAGGLQSQYDVIATFDVIHDAIDPLGLLRAIRQSLRPEGRYVCLEVNCAEQPEHNSGPLSTLRYGFSMLYCMTTSLAHGGAGLGAMGCPESKMQALCREAGFSSMRCAFENRLHKIYEAIP